MRILLVEDNPDDRLLLRRALVIAGLGDELIERESLQAALDCPPVDVALCDLNLPDASGTEAIEAWTARRPEPVIALTGSEQRELGLAAVRAGAQDFVGKANVGHGMLRRVCSYARERAALTKSLRDAHAELHALFHLNPDGLAVVQQGRVRLVNPRATALLEVEVGSPWTRTSPGLTDLYRGEVVLSIRCVHTRWEGEPATLVSVRDVTDQRRERMRLERREAQLERSRAFASLGRLSSGLAHNYNNGIMTLTADVDLLLEEDPRLQERLVGMRRTLDRLLSITRSVAAFSGTRAVGDATRSLDEAVSATIQALQPSLDPSIDLELDLGAGRWRAALADDDVERVVVDLVQNAVTATERGVIRVETRRTAETLRLRVMDEGVGMTPDVLANATQPFFTTNHARPGLGLSAVKGLADAVGGSLQLENRESGGLCVTLQLPGSLPDVEPHRGPIRGVSVLLAEDDHALREVLAHGLRRQGYEVTEAQDGVVALDRLREASFDLVISDIRMPRCDGLELLRRAHERNPAQPFLLMSGFSDVAVPAGVAFISKPVSLTAFAGRVQALLRLTEAAGAS